MEMSGWLASYLDMLTIAAHSTADKLLLLFSLERQKKTPPFNLPECLVSILLKPDEHHAALSWRCPKLDRLAVPSFGLEAMTG